MRSLADELRHLIKEGYSIRLEYDAQFKMWSAHAGKWDPVGIHGSFGYAITLRAALRKAVTRWKEEHDVRP